jgi:hypothetical protein
VGHRRRPAGALHWSAFAGLSTLSFVRPRIALHQPVPLTAEVLRALGNIFGVAPCSRLHRGIRLFVARHR